ncbi:MAG TPA: hypothetical protein VH500_24785 [Nitrososphaeraceae archaeon]
MSIQKYRKKVSVGGLMKSTIPTPVADQDYWVTLYRTISKKVLPDNKTMTMVTTIAIVIIYLIPVKVFGVHRVRTS